MNVSVPQIDFPVPAEVEELLSFCPGYRVAHSIDELVNIATEGSENDWKEVSYDVPGKGQITEAMVARTKNGVAVHYPEPYMRRRDPDCMAIADNLPTNKQRFQDQFGRPFDEVRSETFDWMRNQELIIFPFFAGIEGHGSHGVAIAPANAGFFALGLALLQGIIPKEELPENYNPSAVIYVAPPFRHTHFDEKQVVVHRRPENNDSCYELFSYNLYPGPSAKKGVYGMLLNLGEIEEWVTAHCSTVRVVTPYGNKVTIMHEGASGGGKSEMLEQVHRESDGRLKLGDNITNEEKSLLTLPRGCTLQPVTDDMALCHPNFQKNDGRLALVDAEDSWFIRCNHINQYGVDPHMESISIHPSQPLLFLNIDTQPKSTALIWEHEEDSPGKPCPNPRVVIPRTEIPNIVHGAVSVDIRSFGVRTPPCTKENPSYGILGLFHVLPPALAWLWRLVAPRGYGNPSIVETEGMSSEGVGSYWPFATGLRVDQANLLLRQIIMSPNVHYVLCPNQHVGAWSVGFMPQWLAREYLARRGGARFAPDELTPSRCSLLGYSLQNLMIEGQDINRYFLQVDLQDEVGPEAYDQGADILRSFFHKQLKTFLEDDLLPEGRKIIECCLNKGSVEEYESIINAESIFAED